MNQRSESGTRLRLTMPILEALRNDPSLYVRPRIPNQRGDMPKADSVKVFRICKCWRRDDASPDLQRIIRHVVREAARYVGALVLAIQAAAKAEGCRHLKVADLPKQQRATHKPPLMPRRRSQHT